jgi:hypothetical protein
MAMDSGNVEQVRRAAAEYNGVAVPRTALKVFRSSYTYRRLD